MATITINRKEYTIPDEVKTCMEQLRNDRDWNYMVAEQLNKKPRQSLHVTRIIKGLSGMKRHIDSKQQEFFRQQ
jgi:hypothetical protein